MNRGSPRRFTDDQIAEIRLWWSARVARTTKVTRALEHKERKLYVVREKSL